MNLIINLLIKAREHRNIVFWSGIGITIVLYTMVYLAYH